MNIVITLDYELYFGSHTGSAERTLLEPTEALCLLARMHGLPLVFFVDALWLLRLREQAPAHPPLMAEHYRVTRQLEQCAAAGHELQLHLHPHWQDSHWDGQAWRMDLRRYRLHDFDDASIADMVQRSCALLRSLAGAHAARAFRAGGWCIQPFERLRQPLLEAGVCIDSTVFRGGRQGGGTHEYNFSGAPDSSRWRFDTDPLQPSADGPFLEVPISSHRVSPLLFWRMAAARKLGLAEHRTMGEGRAMPLSRGDLAQKLLQASTSVVSIDGLKSSFLETAWRQAQANGAQDFVIIGHPKALTPYSLDMLARFLRRHGPERFSGLNRYRHELNKPAVQLQAA